MILTSKLYLIKINIQKIIKIIFIYIYISLGRGFVFIINQFTCFIYLFLMIISSFIRVYIKHPPKIIINKIRRLIVKLIYN